MSFLPLANPSPFVSVFFFFISALYRLCNYYEKICVYICVLDKALPLIVPSLNSASPWTLITMFQHIAQQQHTYTQKNPLEISFANETFFPMILQVWRDTTSNNNNEATINGERDCFLHFFCLLTIRAQLTDFNNKSSPTAWWNGQYVCEQRTHKNASNVLNAYI